MKKLLVMLIVSAVIFTACSPEDSSSVSGETSFVANEIVTPEPTPLSNYVNEHIYNYNIHQLLNIAKRENLANSRINATIVRSEKTDGDKAAIKVNFSKDYKNFLAVSADCDIFYMGNGYYSNYVTLSGFNADVQDDKLIVTLHDEILVYSAQDLTLLLTIQPSDSSRKLIDTAVYKDGWISAFVSENTQGFEIYDKNGKFVKDYIFANSPFADTEAVNYNTDTVIYPRTHIKFMDNKREYLVYNAAILEHSDENDIEYIFNLSKNTVNTFDTLSSYDMWPYNNSLKYDFISINNGDDFSDSYMVFTIKDGRPYKSLEIKKSQLPDGFGSEDLHPRGNGYSIDSLTFYCDATSTMVTIHMDSGKVYTIPSRTVQKYKLLSCHEVSADGRYSILSGDLHGGGDVAYSKYFLMENTTGRLKYIDELGGMYGGKEDTGFLQNNDVYTYTYDDFVIFDTDMDNLSPVYRLTDYFSMGENVADDVEFRYLMAARRDPVSKSVLIIYFDYPLLDEEHYEDAYIDYKNNGWQLKATYKVALINPDGTIGYIHDTGVNVLANWGLRPVSMYLENPTSLRIYSWANSHRYTYFEGRMDLTTGTYQSIKDFDISEYQ